MQSEVTPKHIRKTYTEAIDALNLTWDLGLPRLHDRLAEPTSIEDSEARSCASRIRYLSFRPQHASLNNILEDFAEYAKQCCSEWITKPSQERGTLPSSSGANSFIMRDLASRSESKVVKLLTQHRRVLLDHLSRLLKDECDLARSSDVYQRQSAPPSDPVFDTNTPMLSTTSEAASDTITSFVTSASVLKKEPKGRRSPMKEPNDSVIKRTYSQLRDESPRPPKKMLRSNTIKEFFGVVRNIGEVAPWLTARDKPQTLKETSFESSAASQPPEVFTPPPEADNIWSNDTSFLSADEENNPKSPNLFPTQEALEWCQDPNVRRSFHEFETSSPSTAFSELDNHGPMKSVSAHLPPDVPFGVRYELHRLAGVLEIGILELYRETIKRSNGLKPAQDDIWQAARQFSRHSTSGLPDKSSKQAWDLAQRPTQGSNTTYTLNLSGQLTWCDEKTSGLFKLKLSPIKVDKSCRFHRKFGADRFMVLVMPAFAPGQIPKDSRKLHDDLKSLQEKLSSWLATSTHHIVDRRWRLFFVEPVKGQGKKRQEDGPQIRVHLFAVDGHGLQHVTSLGNEVSAPQLCRGPMMIEDFVNWHIPTEHNLGSTDLKTFARFGLGLSKTKSTITLDPHEFIQTPEVKPIMNDGCALMSLRLAQAIASILELDTKQLPSAFQGRISGAKGLWMVDYHDSYPDVSNRGYWIEVTESQLKIKPHPRERLDADPYQRTFEVLKYATPPKTAHLNIQLLTILNDRKVPRDLLRDRLLSDVGSYSDDLLASMDDIRGLCLWMQRYHRATRGSEGVRMLGAFPDSREEQIALLLESGFQPKDCRALNEKLCECLRDEMSRYVEKLQIRIPHSTFVFCIADPCGVLEPGEVHFGATEVLENPSSGMCDFNLDGIDVLVARVPAYLPSDIQKCRVVCKEELKRLRNVIVFPTKGEVPLASLLSGGDYDGDMAWVCWDSAIVTTFQGTDLPPLPLPAECGLEARSRRMEDVFSPRPDVSMSVEEFLTNGVVFNIEPSLLGTVSHEHEKVIYHQNITDMSSPPAVKLAALAGYLVDAGKQGHLLTRDAWNQMRLEVSGKMSLEPPAYKSSEPARTARQDNYGNYENIIDWLKFDVAREAKDSALAQFHEKWPNNSTWDGILSQHWNQACQRADVEFTKFQDSTLKNILKDLKSKVEAINTSWAQSIDKSGSGIWSMAVKKNETTFSARVQSACDSLRAIQPLIGVKHDIIRRFEDEKDQSFSYWSMLRASCVYKLYHMRSMLWYVVGEDLCRMKAESVGHTRVVISPIHSIMKFDRRRVRTVTEVEGDHQEGDLETQEDEDAADVVLGD